MSNPEDYDELTTSEHDEILDQVVDEFLDQEEPFVEGREASHRRFKALLKIHEAVEDMSEGDALLVLLKAMTIKTADVDPSLRKRDFAFQAKVALHRLKARAAESGFSLEEESK
jgi:hypothetical protein